MINGLMVSTETHSNRQVAEDFLRWRAKHNADLAARKARVAARKAKWEAEGKPAKTKRVPQAGRRLRLRAFHLYREGLTAAAVAKELDITYANAHYYKRAFNKENV